MRAAIVNNNLVVNVIEVDDLSFGQVIGEELVEAPIGEIEIGFERREGKWGNPKTHDFIDGEWRNREPEKTVDNNPAGEAEAPDS